MLRCVLCGNIFIVNKIYFSCDYPSTLTSHFVCLSVRFLFCCYLSLSILFLFDFSFSFFVFVFFFFLFFSIIKKKWPYSPFPFFSLFLISPQYKHYLNSNIINIIIIIYNHNKYEIIIIMKNTHINLTIIFYFILKKWIYYFSFINYHWHIKKHYFYCCRY